jgi:hypothetical protein
MYNVVTEIGAWKSEATGMGRRKKEEDHRPIPTPDRQLKTKSGWCSTGYHNGCKYRFTFGKCGCDCHKEKK